MANLLAITIAALLVVVLLLAEAKLMLGASIEAFRFLRKHLVSYWAQVRGEVKDS